jgi:hypothetical protein
MATIHLPIDTLRHVMEEIIIGSDDESQAALLSVLLTSKQWNVRTLNQTQTNLGAETWNSVHCFTSSVSQSAV